MIVKRENCLVGTVLLTMRLVFIWPTARRDKDLYAGPCKTFRTKSISFWYAGYRHLVRRLSAVPVGYAATLGALMIVAVGIPLSGLLNIWIDEAFTLHTTGGGLGTAFGLSKTFEDQPPLYFCIEALWRTFNMTSIAFARLPSVTFTAASVSVLVYCAWRIIPLIPPLAVAIIVAFNPLFVWAAVEMRVYALGLLIGALLTWTWYEGFLASRCTRLSQIFYVVCAIAGLYTQYYIGFFLVAQWLALIIIRRRAVPLHTLAGVLVAIGFAPFVQIALMQVQAGSSFVNHVSFSHALHEIGDAIFAIVLPHDQIWSGRLKILGFLAASVLLLVVTVFGRPALPRGAVAGIVIQWLLCIGIFSIVFTFSGVPPGLLRYIIFLAPSTLLVALLFVSSVRQLPAVMTAIAATAYGVFTLTALWSEYRPPLVKSGEWQRVVATVAQSDNVPVAVFPAEIALPYRWYSAKTPIAIPRAMRFNLNYVHENTLVSEAQVARVLEPVHARANRLWLVTLGRCADLKAGLYGYNCQYLEAYLQRRYHLIKSVDFRGALARLYVN